MELTLARIQMSVTGDKTSDLRRACEAVRKAGKVDMAVLPEMFCCPYDTACFRDYGEAQGGTVYHAKLNAPLHDTKEFSAVPMVEMAAVGTKDGGLALFIVNRDLKDEAEFELDLRGFDVKRVISQSTMHHDDLKAVNTAANPDNVAPFAINTALVADGKLQAKLPAASWNVIVLG